MPRAQGLAIIFSRCNRAAETEAWNRWHREHYFQDLAGHGGPWFASHWQLTPPPAPGRPSPGFTHVTLFEFEGPDPDAQWGALLARHESNDAVLKAAARLHAMHYLLRGCLGVIMCVVQTYPTWWVVGIDIRGY